MPYKDKETRLASYEKRRKTILKNNKKWAKKNRQHLNKYIRQWRKKRDAEQRLKEREWRREYNALHPEIRRDFNKRYYYKNREKVLARQTVYLAVKNGIIVRPKQCAKCGTECVPQGHHADYSMPLVVVWLCDPCHKQIHSAPL